MDSGIRKKEQRRPEEYNTGVVIKEVLNGLSIIQNGNLTSGIILHTTIRLPSSM